MEVWRAEGHSPSKIIPITDERLLAGIAIQKSTEFLLWYWEEVAWCKLFNKTSLDIADPKIE